MQTLHPYEIDLPTYHLWVTKTIGVSSTPVMFMLDCGQRYGLGNFIYFNPHQDLSNNIFSDPNGDCMQNLFPQEVEVQTYHFVVHIIVRISSSRIMFRVKHIQMHCLHHFLYYTPWKYLSNGLLCDPYEDHIKNLCH